MKKIRGRLDSRLPSLLVPWFACSFFLCFALRSDTGARGASGEKVFLSQERSLKVSCRRASEKEQESGRGVRKARREEKGREGARVSQSLSEQSLSFRRRRFCVSKRQKRALGKT